jgi:hypothetical protein
MRPTPAPRIARSTAPPIADDRRSTLAVPGRSSEAVAMRERRDIHRDEPSRLGDVERQAHPDDPRPLFERLAELDRPSLRLRARVRLRRRTLDLQLADGVSPLDDAALALRARQLVCREAREQFAARLEGLVRHAERPPLPRSVAVPLPRRQILEARLGLLALATCLRAERPLYARGMALLSSLLTDGTGPAYRARTDRSLPDALRTAAEALDGGSAETRSA